MPIIPSKAHAIVIWQTCIIQNQKCSTLAMVIFVFPRLGSSAAPVLTLSSSSKPQQGFWYFYFSGVHFVCKRLAVYEYWHTTPSAVLQFLPWMTELRSLVADWLRPIAEWITRLEPCALYFDPIKHQESWQKTAYPLAVRLDCLDQTFSMPYWFACSRHEIFKTSSIIYPLDVPNQLHSPRYLLAKSHISLDQHEEAGELLI